MHALHTADLEAEIMAVYRFVVALDKEHGIDTSSNKREREKIERDPDGFTWVYSRTEQRVETDGDIAKSSQSKCETQRRRVIGHFPTGITSTNHRRQCHIIQDLRILNRPCIISPVSVANMMTEAHSDAILFNRIQNGSSGSVEKEPRWTKAQNSNKAQLYGPCVNVAA